VEGTSGHGTNARAALIPPGGRSPKFDGGAWACAAGGTAARAGARLAGLAGICLRADLSTGTLKAQTAHVGGELGAGGRALAEAPLLGGMKEGFFGRRRG